MTTNGKSTKLGTAYALVIETVEARDIPPLRGTTNWEGLFEELLLRLEKTPIHQALMMTFETIVPAQTCQNRLKDAAKKRGVTEQVDIFRRKLDGKGYAVYVRRSPKWSSAKSKAEVSDFD